MKRYKSLFSEVNIEKNGNFSYITGMTIKQSKNSEIIKSIKSNWEKKSYYIAPEGGDSKHLEVRNDSDEVLIFIFPNAKQLKAFNTEVFYKEGFK